MHTSYDFDKIKFATDHGTFERAVELYEKGKVTKLKEDDFGFEAIVIGTKPYHVSVSARHYDRASCDCYVGQNDTLCKHAVAVAIRAVTGGAPLDDEDKKQTYEPVCSGKLGNVTKTEIEEIKREITSAMKYVKPYNGPSRLWFQYQDSLSEGCARLSAFVSDLPVS